MIAGFLFIGSSLLYYVLLLVLILIEKKTPIKNTSTDGNAKKITISNENTARDDDTCPTIVVEECLTETQTRPVPSYKTKKILTIQIPDLIEPSKPKRKPSELCAFLSGYFKVISIQEQCFPISMFNKDKESFPRLSRLTV